jgi:glycosyltransferase involved in cell wall biosynthesis
MEKLRIIVPVFNDWLSFNLLLVELNKLASTLPVRLAISAINDGSTDSSDELKNLSSLTDLDALEIVNLHVNVGHQRAIAIGLCLAVHDADADAILVMDADGEDSPQAIPLLLQAAAARPDFCVVAKRRKRSENLTFKISYIAYKFIFKLTTAREIDFGNFSLFSVGFARKLVRVPDLWNNLPAAVLRSRLPIQAIPVDRAQRYAGKSKMNFTSLIIHGFSGISVYAETIFVRLLLVTGFLSALTGVSIAFVLSLRLLIPRAATPGWATTVSFGMIIILVQALSVTLSSILMLLNSRVQRLIVPIIDYAIYLDFRQTLLGAPFPRTPSRTISPKQEMKFV